LKVKRNKTYDNDMLEVNQLKFLITTQSSAY
jgi:hypothetical protein